MSDPLPRLLLHSVVPDGWLDVFEVLGAERGVIRVRSAYLFDVGETLQVRIENQGRDPGAPLRVSDATVRVRAHSGNADERVTELEITARSGPVEPAAPATDTAINRRTRELTVEEVDELLLEDQHFADIPERRVEANVVHRPTTCTE